MSTSQPPKDTIYIDAEDEITAIIEKVRESEAKIVALVLPKRLPALQSVVNLKLLKRTASDVKKNLVLITSDSNLLPLAGNVGLHVARTPQSKPEIPSVAKPVPESDETIDAPDTEEVPVDRTMPIGQLAAEETIDLDNDAAEELDAAAVPIKKASKRIKIPDFNRFRLFLFGGIGLLLLLIIGGIFATLVLPRAKITLKTDTTNVNVDQLITAQADAKNVDANGLIVPVISKQSKKTETEKVPATGQRDDGTKASGTVTITNCDKVDDSVTLPAGTVLSTSANGTALGFVTNETITIPQSNFNGSGVCKNDSFRNVAVTAQSAGGQFNLSAHRTFTTGVNGVTGTDSTAMSGGTSKLVQIVSQQDIDNAKQKIVDRLNTSVAAELKTQFSSGNATALSESFAGGTPMVTSTPKVNETGSEVTVTVDITFTEAGVKNDDLKQVVETEAKKHIDSSKQVIQDNGLSRAVIRLTENKLPTSVKFQLQTLVVAGPQLDTDSIKKDVAGKKKGDTQSILLKRPGIKDVTVEYSPFWVFSTPKNTKHINVIFEQSNAK